MEGMLFGYEEWQNDWWIADIRRRRYDLVASRSIVRSPKMIWRGSMQPAIARCRHEWPALAVSSI